MASLACHHSAAATTHHSSASSPRFIATSTSLGLGPNCSLSSARIASRARFISDKVTLHVSREKDGKLRFVYAGWDDTKVVQPDGCGQARRGWNGGAYPLAREAAPPSKIETPQGPPFFTQR
jgi:hypothetical protein